MTSNGTHLLQLPEHILETILGYSNYDTIAKLRIVSIQFFSLIFNLRYSDSYTKAKIAQNIT